MQNLHFMVHKSYTLSLLLLCPPASNIQNNSSSAEDIFLHTHSFQHRHIYINTSLMHALAQPLQQAHSTHWRLINSMTREETPSGTTQHMDMSHNPSDTHGRRF